ncbi:MAG: NAD(P)-dependent oxidoreductase [Candidatus Caldarchaeum sp.]|nr:NAD(P)-dependent oxidoreductase [Candidatus Caldarchaeum sp.]MDW8360303.1 NAD(P)-dependent oxidoreductase [Candidatus Caldarchaeum sp.]
MHVGIIGVGSMGGAVVERLLSLRYSVAIYDLDRQKMEKYSKLGASPTASAAELIANREMIIASLPSVKAVEETFLNSAVLQSVRPETIIVDMSTVHPDTSRRIYNEFKARGAHYLDAPVSGGPRRAATGNLTICVGGEMTAFKRCESLLRVLGEKVFYTGGSGSGSTMKLINQLLVFAHAYAAVEALALSKHLGIDLSKTYEVITNSSGTSFMFEEMGKLILSDKIWNGRTALLVKDIGLTHRMVVDAGLNMKLCSFLKQVASNMVETGFAEDDAVKDFMNYVLHVSRKTSH